MSKGIIKATPEIITIKKELVDNSPAVGKNLFHELKQFAIILSRILNNNHPVF